MASKTESGTGQRLIALLRLIAEGGHPTIEALLTQPAVISVPVAFAVMVLASLADPRRARPPDAELLALHAPEDLGIEAPVRA